MKNTNSEIIALSDLQVIRQKKMILRWWTIQDNDRVAHGEERKPGKQDAGTAS